MRMSGMAGALAKMHTTITFKGDHTFTATVSGIKGMSGGMKQTGKWSQSGNTVSLTSPDRPGHSRKFTFSKGGRQMTSSMEGFTVILTR